MSKRPIPKYDADPFALLGEGSLEDPLILDYVMEAIYQTEDSHTRAHSLLVLEDYFGRWNATPTPCASNPWIVTKDGDPHVLQLFQRHYSCRKSRRPDCKLICGPGRKIVLKTQDGLAGWVWRLERFRNDENYGANNSFFRNEGPIKSSELIQAAEGFLICWPVETMFTFIDPRFLRSRNPGYVYKLAGWQRSDITSKGKLVLTKRRIATLPWC